MRNHIEQTVERITGSTPRCLTPMGGGCFGDVYRMELNNGQAMVAKAGDSGSGIGLEGDMLTYLRQHTALPVPDVLYCDDTLLLMSLLPAHGSLNNQTQRHAADLVAALHDITADHFGFEYDTVIGGLHQPNTPNGSWLAFFAQHRLMYMARQGMEAGRLPATVMAKVEKLCERLDTWLAEPDRPSLIHGDMWGGNVLAHNDRISGFIDPAIYYGHAEIELAFATLFNTFSQSFFDRYREHRPLEPGFFEERRDIYNLYPLLVHVHLFGGSYVGSVQGILTRLGC